MNAQLVASELLTNALRYAGSTATLTLAVDDAGLHVEVGDASPHPPRTVHEPGVHGGYGLRIVDQLGHERWARLCGATS